MGFGAIDAKAVAPGQAKRVEVHVKHSWKNILLFLQAVVIVLLVWALAWLGRDEFQKEHAIEEKTVAAEERPAEDEGVQLDEAAQKQSGIRVETLKPANYHATESFSGVVVDPRSLLEAQQRWDAIKRQIASAEVLIQQRTQEFNRTQGLYDHGRNAAAKDVEAAKSALMQAQQQASGFDAELRAVIDSVRLQWGDAVALGFENRPSWVQKWMQRQIDLIQFSLPAGVKSKKQTWLVESNPMAASGGLSASVVGRATQALPGLVGENWLLSTAPTGLPVGATVRVHSKVGSSEKGVSVPFEAVVRYAGKNWVYVQTEPDRFERQSVAVDKPMTDGFFSDAFDTDDRLVVRGAQLLLSEEFRFQIKNENKD